MNEQSRLPQLLLEQLALDELPKGAGEASALEQLEQRRLAELERSTEQILEEYPPQLVVPRITGRLAEENAARRRRRPLAIAIPALTSAALAVLLVWNLMPRGAEETGRLVYPEQTRIKGEARLIVYRKDGEEALELKDRAVVQAGDQLQLSYVAAGEEYGVIFSIDGRGAVTLHFPGSESNSSQLAQGGAEPLSFAYELDDAPRFERFVFVTSDSPIDIRAVLNSGRALSDDASVRLELPAGHSQHHVTVLKSQAEVTQ